MLKVILAFLLSTSFLQAATTALPTIPTVAYSFLLVPKELQVQSSTLVKLSAVLYGSKKATLLATLKKNGKVCFKYSHELRKFMKKQGATRSEFLPLEAFLTEQVGLAAQDPQPYLVILAEYLSSGTAPSFTLDLPQ
jgi:hypothetical protein